MTENHGNRRRPQFSLRLALLAFVIVSVPLTWIANRLQVARRQRQAVAELSQFPGIIRYNHQHRGQQSSPDAPHWCCRLFGEDFFARVTFVCLGGGDHFTDAHLKDVAELRQLEELRLGGSAITDEGLAYLRPLTELRTLSLAGTKITDRGLARLQPLPHLQRLWLSRTQISDQAIGTLAQLRGLQHLDVQGTRVSLAGVERLRAALPNCQVVNAAR